jgi:hypothetical protein
VLIFPPVTIPADRWLKQSRHLASFFFSGLGIVLVLFFIFYPLRKKEASIPGGVSQKVGKFIFPYEAIGTGGLALHPRHALGWVSRLADELVLIAYNSRPDVESKDAKILVSLKNGKEQLTLPNGRTIFLKESEQGKGLHSSEDATSLWAKPILLENGAVLIEAGRKLISKDGKVGEEKGQFIVAGQGGVPPRYNSANQAFAKALKSGRVFPYDLLIQKYGGREYAAWREKAVIELSQEGSTYACFVSPGDYLLYENGEWRVCSLKELKSDRPIAQVKTISEKTVEMEAWDETGFCPLPLKFEMEKQGHSQLKAELMPAAIRLRSGTQVSCAFGKRRVILKQGDWLLKTSTGWRNLRRSEEIEQYLHHRLKGELLIFDSIEKEQGRSVMKGHLFDESRTQVQPLTLPIEADKTPGKASRKRKPIFSADRRAT